MIAHAMPSFAGECAAFPMITSSLSGLAFVSSQAVVSCLKVEWHFDQHSRDRFHPIGVAQQTTVLSQPPSEK
jgi:hypothetical protein